MSTKTDWRNLAEIASDMIGYECRHTGIPDESVPGLCPECWELGGKVADEILAAGYRKPQQVTTVEEVEALYESDVNVVMVDEDGLILQNLAGGWGSPSLNGDMLTSRDAHRLFGPNFTVLHVGGAE